MSGNVLETFRSLHTDEDGDVPGWVLIVLMTSALVIAIWGIARERLVAIVASALSTVCGPIGC